MFQNEGYINIQQEDALTILQYQYEIKKYKFYWRFTKNESFLYKYQKALKQFLMIRNKITTIYLKDIKFIDYFIDLANNRIVYMIQEDTTL